MAGLVGMTMFALTFILSMRLRFVEDLFGGLDKVYIAHGILGGTALMLLLFHPILLVLKFIPSDLRTAALYLLPSAYWSVNFGIIALVGLALLVAITLYSRMKYHTWKFTHEFLGLVFLFAALHVFLVDGNASRDYIFRGYDIFAVIVSLIGLGAFSYSLLLKNRILKEAIYRIELISQKKDMYEIRLVPDGKPIQYTSGQFIFVRFYNEKLSKEAHPFTIASKSNNPTISIMVKNLGDFTSGLHHLKTGDKVAIEGPYGRFNMTSKNDTDQIWIAGGIGITPFLGMAEDLIHKGRPHKVDLYYSARGDDDFIGLDTLTRLEKTSKNFRVFPWASDAKGRIGVKDIQKNSGNLKTKEYFLCGPGGFKTALKEALIEAGVKESNIYEEEFTFR
ncbi:MAG: ferric reductase-like transmembrane domain-containing protein [Nanoarchaeota archaeon]